MFKVGDRIVSKYSRVANDQIGTIVSILENKDSYLIKFDNQVGNPWYISGEEVHYDQFTVDEKYIDPSGEYYWQIGKRSFGCKVIPSTKLAKKLYKDKIIEEKDGRLLIEL